MCHPHIELVFECWTYGSAQPIITHKDGAVCSAIQNEIPTTSSRLTFAHSIRTIIHTYSVFCIFRVWNAVGFIRKYILYSSTLVRYQKICCRNSIRHLAAEWHTTIRIASQRCTLRQITRNENATRSHENCIGLQPLCVRRKNCARNHKRVVLHSVSSLVKFHVL